MAEIALSNYQSLFNFIFQLLTCLSSLALDLSFFIYLCLSKEDINLLTFKCDMFLKLQITVHRGLAVLVHSGLQ